jgi:hypothetical protein
MPHRNFIGPAIVSGTKTLFDGIAPGRPRGRRKGTIHKIAPASLAICALLAAPCPVNAGQKAAQPGPLYQGRSEMPAPAFAAEPPAAARLDSPERGCVVTYTPTEAVRGIRPLAAGVPDGLRHRSACGRRYGLRSGLPIAVQAPAMVRAG